MDFINELKKYQNIINTELKKYLIKDDCYEKVLYDSMEHTLMGGGKRIRAILILVSYKLFKNDFEKCMPFAVAIEMIHNFSLIHDDLPEIDDDDTWHGKPSNHIKFGHGTALLTGDKLFNYAYMVLSKELLNSIKSGASEEELQKQIIVFNEITNAVDKMVNGEYLDTVLEGQDISLDLLKYIHKNKTGEFLKLPVKIGAILAGASQNDIDKLSGFADKIGLAFQIKDDILSEEGDEKVIGKPVGNDQERNKCTYVAYYGLEGAKKELDKLIEDAIQDLNSYGEKAEFLRNLAIYIKDRDK